MRRLVFININSMLSKCLSTLKLQSLFEGVLLELNYKVNLFLNFSIKKLIVYRRYARSAAFRRNEGVMHIKISRCKKVLEKTEFLINFYKQNAERRLLFWRKKVLKVIESKLLIYLNLLSRKLNITFINYESGYVVNKASVVHELVTNFINKRLN